jgi:hypothetical protein
MSFKPNYNESLDDDQIGVAYQYKIRMQKAEEEKNNPYWLNADLDLKNAIVKPVDRSLAKKIIEEYEWLGCMPAVSMFYFGIFFGDVCGGVVCFGPEYSENLGIWDKYGYTGKMLLLNRGVCLHWTPKNTGSKLVMRAIKMLDKKYEIITVTTDHLAGEVGTIYQACNFYYVGSMRDSNPNVKSKKGDRFGVVINGKLYSARACRAKFGSQKKGDILKHHPDAQFVKQRSKHRYFLYRGSNEAISSHKKAMEHIIKPYIKR